MKNTLLNVVSGLIAPCLLAQGLYVRRYIPKLAEASGARCGQLGKGRPLSMLIVGDSAAAGVGADAQHEALAGQITQRLARQYAVRWQLMAKTGLTTFQLKHFLAEKTLPQADVILVISGVNDVTSVISARTWLKHLDALMNYLKQHCQSRLLVVSPVPPMHRCPALPQPLRWHLSRRVHHFNRHLAKHIACSDACTDLTFDFPINENFICRDGFHPSPLGYQHWAQVASDRIFNILDKEREKNTGASAPRVAINEPLLVS